ncbi:MAG: GIY-YIG nuclease family protein [Cocleimonas sp.]|nr:GIY-YIG nuclease family protein [Cocleimonas sp.]
MRDFHLRFYKWFDGFINLMDDEEDIDCIPNKSGAYVIGTSDGTMLTYPWGSSPVFYIGQSLDLHRRLLEHQRYICKAIDDHEEDSWWPRYQFGASFGADVAWYSCRGIQDPKNLEADLINKFYETYGSIPLANGTWPKGIRRPKVGSRDDK